MKKVMIYTLIGFVALILITILITFPFFKKQMKEANERIKSDSRRLETRFGEMEYAISDKESQSC